jgi:hypothetical protein
MELNYSSDDTFISINEGLYAPFGFLDIIQTASLLSISPLDVLEKLSTLNIIYMLTSHYTKYAVVRINQQALMDNVIRLRPTFNDTKECPLQQILLSSELIEYIKTI